MSFFKASKKSEDVKQGGSNYITGSGMYPVTILAPMVDVSDKGSTTINLYVDYQGQKQVIYGNLRITNNNDSPNKIGAKIFNQMLIIAGLDSVDDPVEVELPIGKDGATKTVAILEDLCDLEVVVRIQMEYSKWNGAIQEKKVIKAFFRAEDHATAEEIVHETDPGKGYERELKYADNITYKDDLTPEDIAEWIKNGRKNEGEEEAPKKAPAFGKKRFNKSSD